MDPNRPRTNSGSALGFSDPQILDMRMVECPFCEGYEGEESAVRAHISSKIDDDHSGHSGFDVRLGEGYECGDCGADLERHHQYCHQCGLELGWSKI